MPVEPKSPVKPALPFAGFAKVYVKNGHVYPSLETPPEFWEFIKRINPEALKMLNRDLLSLQRQNPSCVDDFVCKLQHSGLNEFVEIINKNMTHEFNNPVLKKIVRDIEVLAISAYASQKITQANCATMLFFTAGALEFLVSPPCYEEVPNSDWANRQLQVVSPKAPRLGPLELIAMFDESGKLTPKCLEYIQKTFRSDSSIQDGDDLQQMIHYLQEQGNIPGLSELERQVVLFPVPACHYGALLQQLKFIVNIHTIQRTRGFTNFNLLVDASCVSFPFSVLSQFVHLQNGASNVVPWPVIGACGWEEIASVMAVNGRLIQFGIAGDECPSSADGFYCGPFSYSIHDLYHLVRYTWTTPNFRALAIRVRSLVEQWKQAGLVDSQRADLFKGGLLDNEWLGVTALGTKASFNAQATQELWLRFFVDVMGNHPILSQRSFIPFLFKDMIFNSEDWQRETFGLELFEQSYKPVVATDFEVEGLSEYYQVVCEKIQYAKESYVEEAKEVFVDEPEEQHLYVSEKLDELALEISQTTAKSEEAQKGFLAITDDIIV